MRNLYIRLSGLIFFVVAVLHAWRYFVKMPVSIGATYISLEMSAIAALGAGLLAIMAFKVR